MEIESNSLYSKDPKGSTYLKSLSLRDLSYVVFDLETTGLYADEGDEIIEIGAIAITGLELQEESFQTLVNPGKPIPAASSAVHGIQDKDVKKAPPVDQAVRQFCQFCTGRHWVAQNARFDLSFILKTCQKLQMPLRQNIVIDTIGLSKMIFPYETSHNLDSLMARLGIAKTGERHRSLDDCRYTALAFIEMIKLLEKQGVSSLMEIQSSMIKPESLLKAQKPKSAGLFG